MKRVLSICGGGIFGLMPAMWCEAIEAQTGKPCAEFFDFIAGTSTGAIIAAGLAAGIPASTIVSLYRDQGGAIFHGSFERKLTDLWGLSGPKYDAAPLESRLQQHFGNKTLKDATVPLLVPTTQCEPVGAYWFKSWAGPNIELWKVCRATSAAPYYFPPAEIEFLDGSKALCADGGMWANNPEDRAIAEASALFPGESISLVSMGTGCEPFSVPAKADWGAADWAPSFIEMFMQLSEDAAVARSLEAGTQRIWLDAEIGGDMDDASPENLAALAKAAEGVIASAPFSLLINMLAPVKESV